jgi:hypothetical protein
MKSSCYFYQIIMKLEFSREILKKTHQYQVHENPSSGSRGFPCGQTDRKTDVTKIIVAFHNFSKAPKTLRSAHTGRLCVLCV